MLGRGGSVRLVGDDQQLASVAAGGVLRDIADTHGAATLTQLHRFTDPAEAAATLALRAGDPAAISYYLDQGRVTVGDRATAADTAYAAWAADRAAGLDSLLLAPTRDLATSLNARARTDRLALTASTPGAAGREVALRAGNCASAGDTVITRRNHRRLSLGATDWVKNGDRFTVRDVLPDGAVLARHHDTSRHVTFPAGYVHDHLELGYASTVHAAQGVTVDTAHTILTGTETRQLLYVAATRGRHANHLHLAATSDGDPDALTRPDTLRPPTPGELLARVVARDGAQVSATSTAAARAADPATRLADAAARYHDALTAAAEHLHGPHRLAALDAAAEQAHPGLTAAPAYPTLRARLVLHAAHGQDPIALLQSVTGPDTADLATAADPAAVLDWRLHRADRGAPATSPRGAGASDMAGPLPWLPGIPRRLADDPSWGPYLRHADRQVRDLAGQVRRDADGWTPATAPAWAVSLPHRSDGRPDVALRGDLAVWRAATGIPHSDARPAGPPHPAAAQEAHRQRLADKFTAALPGTVGGSSWAVAANAADPRLTADPYWPVLADQLAQLHAAGHDIPALLTRAAAGRPLPDEQPAAALHWRLTRLLNTDLADIRSAAFSATTQPAQSPTDDSPVDDVETSDLAGGSPEVGEDAGGYDLQTGKLLLLAAADAATAARRPLPPTDDDVYAAHEQALTWAAAAVPRDRIVALNRAAADYFTARYPGSWAQHLLRERLHTDPAEHGEPAGGRCAVRYRPGYAPPGWTNLTDHLRRTLGASDTEILAAGLGRRITIGPAAGR